MLSTGHCEFQGLQHARGEMAFSWHTSLFLKPPTPKSSEISSELLDFVYKNMGCGYGADIISTVSQSLTPLQISGIKLFLFSK